MFPKGKKILFAVLDWGLGHASRSIPLIKNLIYQQNTVIIASSGSAFELLKTEFPGLAMILLPSYQIQFGSSTVIKSILLKSHELLSIIQSEKKITDNFVKTENIDLIISDNRYGCYNKNIESILITHQLNIPVPKKVKFLSIIPQFVNKVLLNNFNEIWIPDMDNSTLSGKLSDNKKIHPNIRFIGILSRFQKNLSLSNKNEIFAWVSGPEPHRTTLINKLISQLENCSYKSTLVLGQPEKYLFEQKNQLTIVNHLNISEFEEKIRTCNFLICRSGYSTLMDLATLEKKALLIPTPTQTEQEYLAKKMSDDYGFMVQNQNDLKISEYIERNDSNSFFFQL